jgi:hypothetical protein
LLIFCSKTFLTSALKITSSQTFTEVLFAESQTIGVFIFSQERVTKYLDESKSLELLLSQLLSFKIATK